MDYQPKMASVNGEYEQDDRSKLGVEFSSTLNDDLCSFHMSTMEVDVSLEWLSAFVEECLSAKGSSSLPLPPPKLSTQLNNPPTPPPNSLFFQSTLPSSDSQFSHFATVPGKARSKRRPAPPNTSTRPLTGRRLHQLNQLQNKHSLQLTSSSADPLLLQQTLFFQSTLPSSDLPFSHFATVPGKARSKRRRPPPNTSTRPLTGRRLHQLNLLHNKHSLQFTSSSADPLLLQQTYWLADSELLLPHKAQGGGEGEKMVDMDQRDTAGKKSLQMQQQQGAGSGRRCSHCQAQRTPQWRGGPLGPKTLCNACGVRYKKSGKLLPEYRPANSPTFVSFLHSNSHKRVMEMRMINASSTSTAFPSTS